MAVAKKLNNKSENMVWVTFEKEGIHKYPAALDTPELADVYFLGYPHRHMFKFVVCIEVFHDDRDIEFILFKRWLESLYAGSVLSLDFKSCEMISDDLYEQIAAKFPGRKVVIEVSEDGENGSYAVYEAVSPEAPVTEVDALDSIDTFLNGFIKRAEELTKEIEGKGKLLKDPNTAKVVKDLFDSLTKKVK